ncbi:MAG: NAD(P)/FAD-dependent oxidoreductase [Rhizobium sp.]|uniref:NAD(P)/FAD-dependent oxidoreductase n=1 Tax=Rhizobium sp. TaxID=391 RepID=UPI00389AE542
MVSRETKAYDAIVVGGGPAGGTAALLLSKAGWSVALVEKAVFPRRKVCGEFISAASLPLLAELGVDASFAGAAGPPVRRIALYSGEVIVDAPMPKVQSAGAGWGRALGREQFDLLLLDGAARAGAHVWQPWRVVSARRSGGRWICSVAGETTQDLSAPVLIGAAGSWDRGPFPSMEHSSRDDRKLLAFKAHFRDFSLAEDLMPLLAFPGGYGGLVNSDNGRVSLSCCIKRDVLDQCRRAANGRAGDAVLHHIGRSCAGVRQAIGRAKLEGAWLAAGPIRPGIRAPYLRGVFMAGNIAGEAHPIIAEGISMAMQSSWLLARHLIASGSDLMAGGDPTRIGRDYADDWRATFGLRIHAAALFARLAASRRAANLCRPVLQKFPMLLTLGATLSGKTKLLTQLSSSSGQESARLNMY